MPIDTLYSKPISIFNPHDDILYVKEVFISGEFFRITLPSKESDDNTSSEKLYNDELLWAIRPHERKPVIVLQFCSTKSGVYQGFLNIVTNQGNFTVPIDISSVIEGVHIINESLDFGTMSVNESRSIEVYFLNVETEETEIKRIDISDNLIENIFINTVIPPKERALISIVTFHAKQTGHIKGDITFTLQNGSTLHVPYTSKVIDGQITYTKSDIEFYISHIPVLEDRKIVLKNSFDESLTIKSIGIKSEYFRIVDYKADETVNPEAYWSPIHIQFASDKEINGVFSMEIQTNVSVITIPLICYDGKLQLSIYLAPENASIPIDIINNQANLSLNVIKVGKKSTFIIKLSNPNDISVPVIGIDPKLDGVVVDIYDDLTKEMKELIYGNQETILVNIPPKESIVISISIVSHSPGARNGDIIFKTLFNTLAVKVSFTSIEGSIIIPNEVDLTSTSNAIVRILNSYGTDVEITDVAFDHGFNFTMNRNLIPAHTECDLGLLSYKKTRNLPQSHEHMELVKRKIGVVITTNIPTREEMEIEIVIPRTRLSQEKLDFGRRPINSTSKQFLVISNNQDFPLDFQLVYNADSMYPFSFSKEVQTHYHIMPNQQYQIGPILFTPEKNDVEYKHKLVLKKKGFNDDEHIELIGLGGIQKVVLRQLDLKSHDNESLLFIIEESELEKCIHSHSGEVSMDDMSPLVFKRQFLVSNQGNIPIHIKEISSEMDSRFGFSLEGNVNLILAPSESHTFSISYIPDFSSPYIKSLLHIETDSESLYWDIHAHLPEKITSKCLERYKVTVRRHFLGDENAVYYILVAILILLLTAYYLNISNDKKHLDSMNLDIRHVKTPKAKPAKKKRKESKCLNIFSKELQDQGTSNVDPEESILVNNPFYFEVGDLSANNRSSRVESPSKIESNFKDKKPLPSDLIVDKSRSTTNNPQPHKKRISEKPNKKPFIDKKSTVDVDQTQHKSKSKSLKPKKRAITVNSSDPIYKPDTSSDDMHVYKGHSPKRYSDSYNLIKIDAQDEQREIGVIGSGLERGNDILQYDVASSNMDIDHNSHFSSSDGTHYNPLFSLPPVASSQQESAFSFFAAPYHYPTSYDDSSYIFEE